VVGAQFSPGAGDTAPLQRVDAGGPQTKPAVGYLLKGAGLVAVAVVSGLLWWLVRHETPQAVAQPPAQNGEFAFTIANGPQVSTNCEENAYDKTKTFFADNPCQRLSRALYTTTSGGAKALVSVVLVTMPDAASANQLKALTDKDGTGNVNDLIKDGTAKIDGAPKIYKSQAQYDSRVNGSEVTIVMTDFFANHQDKALLQRIAFDALRLSDELRR
jgi:hypothetical protein